MIETLLILGCLRGTADSCEAGATAYYSYSGIERIITQKEQAFTGQYPLLTTVIALGAGASQGVAIINLGQGRSIRISKDALINFKGSF